MRKNIPFRLIALPVVLVAALTAPVALAKKPPKPPKPAPPAPGQLSLVEAPPVIVFGATSALTGTLTGVPQVADVEVTLQQAPYPFTRFRDLGKTRTDAAGNFAFQVVPTANTRYKAVARTPNADTVSPEVDVLVKFKVTIAAGGSGIAGNVYPANDGGPVQLQKRVRGGYRTVKRGRLFDAGADHSKYRFRRPSGAGVYRVRVPADPDNLTGTSSARRLR